METCREAKELGRSYDLAKELVDKLDDTAVGKSLAQELVASLEKAISIAESSTRPNSTNSSSGHNDSPGSFAGSSSSEHGKRASKKRKAQSRCTNQVKVKLGTGPEAEGPLDDGYSWRKYGQKEIFGAKHPRGYFRCTYSKSRSCLAMRQVQESDDDPLIYDVTYRGSHTCDRTPPVNTSSLGCGHHHDNNQLPVSFQTNHRVQTQNAGSNVQEPSYASSFHFPTTTDTSAFFSPTTTSHDQSNYLSASTCVNLQAPESGATSANTHSSMFDDYLLPLPDLDPELLLFDVSSFFSLDN